MKRILFLLLLVVSVLAMSHTVVAADDEADLIALDKKWGDANVSGDVAVLDEIYADDVMLLGAQGVAGKKQALEGAKANAGKTKNPSYANSDFKVVFLDKNTAVMTHRAIAKGVRDGKAFTNDHQSMHVFVKRSGRWQVVANSATPVNP